MIELGQGDTLVLHVPANTAVTFILGIQNLAVLDLLVVYSANPAAGNIIIAVAGDKREPFVNVDSIALVTTQTGQPKHYDRATLGATLATAIMSYPFMQITIP